MKTIDLQKYLVFWLKRIEKTQKKYLNYTPKSTIEFDDDDLNSCLDYGVWFWEIAHSKQNYFQLFFQRDKGNFLSFLSQKRYLRSLKTFVNIQTFEYHIQAYKDAGYTDSQARSLAIRFYLRNYEKINAKMREFMLEWIVSYCTVFNEDIQKQANDLI